MLGAAMKASRSSAQFQSPGSDDKLGATVADHDHCRHCHQSDNSSGSGRAGVSALSGAAVSCSSLDLGDTGLEHMAAAATPLLRSGIPSVHFLDHLRSELNALQENLQGQIDALKMTVSEGRLTDQRAHHRDRELIMQAILKQRSDVSACMEACRSEAAGAASKAAKEAILSAMEVENLEREKIYSAHLLEDEANLKMMKVRVACIVAGGHLMLCVCACLIFY